MNDCCTFRNAVLTKIGNIMITPCSGGEQDPSLLLAVIGERFLRSVRLYFLHFSRIYKPTTMTVFVCFAGLSGHLTRSLTNDHRIIKLAVTSPDVISASPKNILTSTIDFTVLLLFEFLKKTSLARRAS